MTCKRPLPFFPLLVVSVLTGLVLLPARPAVARPSQSLKMFERLQSLIINVSNRVKASVVHVEVNARHADVRRKRLGSGLIISSDGRIVTNYHVIDQAQYISVTLEDGSSYQARVLRKDSQTDLALLKIHVGHPLPAATLANSDKVRVGEWVLAIGNPYGFDRTVSFGIVSGKGRYIPGLDTSVPLLNDFIQTDAMIDPGSSGGPLVDLKGDVIGINSVGIGRGQGFTIPSNVVKEVLTRAEIHGRIERGWLGVYLQPFTTDMAKFFGVPGKRGVLVSDVQADSPADHAGLRSGDVILTLNRKPVGAERDDDVNRFAQMVTALHPGSEARLTVLRHGSVIDKTVTVGIQPPVDAREIDTHFGMLVKQITYQLYIQYRLESRHGVLVSYVADGGVADNAGLQVGDVITGVDGKPVKDLSQFQRMLPELHKKTRFLLTVKRGKVTRYALMDMTMFEAPKHRTQPRHSHTMTGRMPGRPGLP